MTLLKNKICRGEVQLLHSIGLNEGACLNRELYSTGENIQVNNLNIVF